MNNLNELISNLNSALALKESIVNNLEPYYHNVTVSVKHGTRIGPFKGHPYYTHHIERRFNQALYDQTLANANSAINQVGAQIQPAINDFHSSMLATSQELATCFDRYQTALNKNNELNSKIEQKQIELQKLHDHNEKELRDHNEKLLEYNNNSICLKEQLKSQTEAISDIFKSADLSLRSFYLSELWLDKNNEDNKKAIALIKSLGFDANMVAFYAIENNNEELLELAIENKADFSNYFIEDKTLLQKIINSNNKHFVDKILMLKDVDIRASILNAIDNDMKTINELLKYKPELLNENETTFFGYTLLQIAISVGNQGLVEKILATDSSSVNSLSSNGESAFKIAIRSGNDGIIKLLKENVNLKIEIEQLTCCISSDIKAKILNENDTDALIQLFKGDTNILIQYSPDDEKTDTLDIVPKFDEDYILKTLDLNDVNLTDGAITQVTAPRDMETTGTTDNNQLV